MGSEKQSRTNCRRALGKVPLRLNGNLKDIGVDTSIILIQKSALLGSAKSIGNVKDRKKKHFGIPWQLVVARHHNFTSC